MCVTTQSPAEATRCATTPVMEAVAKRRADLLIIGRGVIQGLPIMSGLRGIAEESSHRGQEESAMAANRWLPID